jgi:ABC-2 type transport system permease protein
MLRNVFTKSLWDRRRSTMWWTLGMVAMTAWLVAVYPVIRDSDAMQSFLDDFPPELMAMFGIDPDVYLTGAGYLQAQLFSFIAPIILIAFAVGFGVTATASEEKSGTMDMLLSLPISRRSIVLQKAAAMALLAGILTLAVAATLVILDPVVGLKLSIDGVAAVTIGLWLLGIVFGGVAMTIGAFTGSPSTAGGLAGFLAILSWFVTGFSAIFGWLEVPSKLSPFGWYLDGIPLLDGFSSGHVWLAVACAATIVTAAALFARRNIATERTIVRESTAGARESRGSRGLLPRSTWLLGNVFGKTVWDRRRTVWYWAIGLASMLFLTFAAWPALSRDTQALEGLVNSMPKEVLAMFGVTDPGALATPQGFVSSRTYGSVGPIVVIVFAITAMTAFVAKEESSGQLDLLLSNPLKRGAVIPGKTAGVASLLGVIVLSLIVVAFAGNVIWNLEFDPVAVIAANVGLGLLGLCFWGIAVALWSLLGSSGPAVGITSAIVVASFFMNGLGAIVNGLAFMRYLSPFYWYLGDTVPLAKGFTFGYLALGATAIIGSAIATERFARRDLAV